MRTPELCTTVISLMTGMLQLQAPALGMPFVKQYCEENQPHIYMICVRPRISIHPEITQDGADWKLTFMINKSGQYESQTHVINLPEGVRFGEPVYPYYEIPLIDHSGQKTLSASILLQRLCEQVIPCEHIPESMYSHENRLSGILRSVKLLYYQLLMSTDRRANLLRSESSGAPDF
jgi:hypothetical protein